MCKTLRRAANKAPLAIAPVAFISSIVCHPPGFAFSPFAHSDKVLLTSLVFFGIFHGILEEVPPPNVSRLLRTFFCIPRHVARSGGKVLTPTQRLVNVPER